MAEVGPDAAFERRALGFAVASSPFGALLLTDQATGSACRLGPGEGAFVRDGTFQRRESLGETPQEYLRIGLVPAAAVNDAGGDFPIFAGPAFASPAGAVILSLARVELAAGDVFTLAAGPAGALVLVEQGELELATDAGRATLTTVVGSDTSYAVRSIALPATLTGRRAATSVLLAVVA